MLGLCLGFLWGTGCSLAIMYSIYLGGYRKAVEDSLIAGKVEALSRDAEKVESRRDARSSRVRAEVSTV